MNLGDIPLGGRLIIRSRKDWRSAVVSRKSDEKITISIASPTGYNYRVRRDSTAEIGLDGRIAFLLDERSDKWRDNFSTYDKRW